MTVVAVVQARLSSQRLPGKVLATLPSRSRSTLTVLDWTVLRTRRAVGVDEVVVATSTDPRDDALVEHCVGQGYRCYRGSLDDVLDRVHGAAADADTVVRITADCPLVDPEVVDEVLARHLSSGDDFTANRLPPPASRTWPIGLDVEVVSAAALDRAWREADQRHQREHVLPYVYETPGRFSVSIVECPVDAGAVRWTIDTPQDLEAVRELVHIAQADLDTGWRDLLAAWRAHPDIGALNAAVSQRSGSDVDPR